MQRCISVHGIWHRYKQQKPRRRWSTWTSANGVRLCSSVIIIGPSRCADFATKRGEDFSSRCSRVPLLSIVYCLLSLSFHPLSFPFSATTAVTISSNPLHHLTTTYTQISRVSRAYPSMKKSKLPNSGYYTNHLTGG